MYFQSVIRITFLVFLLYQFRIKAFMEVLPGCQSRCGNISIPYPLGIGNHCSRDQWFEVVCNKTGSDDTERAFITSINAELTSVPYFPHTYEWQEYYLEWFEIKGSIISSNCSGRGMSSSLNLTGSPFVFSKKNQFVAVGCNTRAAMTKIHPQIIHCEPICKTETSFDVAQDAKDGHNDTSFCQATIPSDFQVFDVKFEKLNTSISRDECNLAFLASKSWLNDVGIDKNSVFDMDFVPLVLEWEINILRLQSISISCSHRKDDSNLTECHCVDGYEGNPYLPWGCEDIDECKEETHNCKHRQICVNTVGSHHCRESRTWVIFLGTCLGFGVFFALIGTWILYKFLINRKEIKLRKKFFKLNGGLLLKQQLSANEQGNIDNMIVFTSKELQKATDNFSDNRILGQGGQGTVYKGMLVDGRIVAVKKSKLLDETNLEGFINEVVILSQINHRNVVKLFGCCLETEVPLLVYEYIPDGNLYEFLQLLKEEPPLSWEMRLRIAMEASGALAYLHSAAAIPIYHRDIKSTNILLDEKYRAKVSDFGTSRSISIDQTHLTTKVKGTFGYFDPEYFRSSLFTDKSDVYSFGVVLVELLTGQKPISLARAEDRRSLVVHFLLSMEENPIVDLIDPHVRQQCTEEVALAFANVAKRCLKLNGKSRPSMKEVAWELQQISGFSQNVETNHEDINNSWELPFSTSSESLDNSVFSLEVEPLAYDVPFPSNSSERPGQFLE